MTRRIAKRPKVIQLGVSPETASWKGGLWALCDDGSIWVTEFAMKPEWFPLDIDGIGKKAPRVR